MAFLGEITDMHLQEVLFSQHPLILHGLKRIMGKEFLMAYHRYRANANIPTFFPAILIYMGTSKQQAKLLTQMMFKHRLLGEIDIVLDNIDANLRIPLPQNYYMSLSNEAEVKKLMIVNSLDFASFQATWLVISTNIEFLLKAAGIQSGFTSNWRAIFLYGEDLAMTDDLRILRMVMFAKYLNNGRRESIFKFSNLPFGSVIWIFLCKCRAIIIPRLLWVVHNGRKARFWDETWNGHYSLISIIDWSPLIAILTSLWGVYVADYFDIVHNDPLRLAKWKSIDFLDVDLHLKVEFDKVLGERFVTLSDSEDELIWFGNDSGKYSVKDGYNSLIPAKTCSYWPYKLFWHLACLPKAEAFAWLSVQDRFLTGMSLDRLGIIVVFSCVICNKNLESSSHLFLHCDFAHDNGC
ncbi:uncharacterized protein LOC131875787 [Cryptomeria japonica]|uniref:uncharacterized protein LOC131875787 n=1 Tax=Cryptomeria japonica TaxID=3369 RepID=UPI0027D9D189|nr:uncharacterized protein LOC131875787 [Cryptomeria japonica]